MRKPLLIAAVVAFGCLLAADGGERFVTFVSSAPPQVHQAQTSIQGHHHQDDHPPDAPALGPPGHVADHPERSVERQDDEGAHREAGQVAVGGTSLVGGVDLSLHGLLDLAAAIGGIFTPVLAYYGWRQARAGEIAAKAAKESADASVRQGALLLAQEAPLLLAELDLDDPHLLGGVNIPAVFNPAPRYRLTNYGRSPALTRYIGSRSGIGLTTLLTADTAAESVSDVIAAAKRGNVRHAKVAVVDKQETVAGIMDLELTLWLTIEVRYSDVFGSAHGSRSTFIFSPRTRRFERRASVSRQMTDEETFDD